MSRVGVLHMLNVYFMLISLVTDLCFLGVVGNVGLVKMLSKVHVSQPSGSQQNVWLI